ncbi:MAG: pyrroline-5-carboxylate reductase [Candidatus Hydrogenedentes bacterium]|nr:pyrroline-5-carboxylate reductase [Candidatus Hydrogenedentota bacterium]
MNLEGTLGFLGFGNMGQAIARGLLDTGTVTPRQILIFDIDEKKLEDARALGVSVVATSGELAQRSEVLILAVKPQSMADALRETKCGLAPDTLIISIAAGISLNRLEQSLGTSFRIVRVMPNTPALVGAGAAAAALNSQCTEADIETTRAIFEAVGIVEIVREEVMDAVTALSGSGPAYFFHFVEILAAAGTAHGLSGEQAVRLAAQTLSGAGRLLRESGESAEVLRQRVTSKGGTTEAALNCFKEQGLERIVRAGFDAAVARSKALGA